MSEGQSHLEGEIAQLQQAIEEKRRLLESEHGIVREDKEIVREVVASHVYKTPIPQPSVTQKTTKPGSSYLDTLDEEEVGKLNALIQTVPEKGIKKTVEEAQLLGPFFLDAFHDALVDRLYDELKSRGVVK